MIFTSLHEQKKNVSEQETIQPLGANIKVYSPKHDEVLFETTMPFMNEDQDERFWVAFCLRGGRGINTNGVTVADSASTM